ncbi:MAG: alpha/beta hydrolase family protein [Planctomycetaceae bacterium]
MLCKFMTHGLVAAFLLTSSFAMGQSDGVKQAKKTTWTGTLDARGTKLRLEVDVINDGKSLSGELRSLDQGNVTLKLAEIETDGELRFKVPRLSAQFNGKYTKDGGIAEGTFNQSGVQLSLKLTKASVTAATPPAKEKLKEAWVGKLEMGFAKPVMQFRIVEKGAGGTSAYFDSVTEGQTGFDATWSIEDGRLKFDVPQIKLTYEGKLNRAEDSAEGTWTQAGRAFPLTLKKQLNAYDNENVWEKRPQRPVAPFPYDSIEVKFENKSDSLTLAGTLTVPKKPGRHPVIILISGSGPQDRDETLMGHKPFLVLADYLSRRGIAVLRYDDRGTAESSGKFEGATTEAFARDASAAVAFLKKHERINAKQIGLGGHSEGGLIAPMVVGSRNDVAFVVLMAATGVDGKEIVITQSEAMARAEGAPEDEIKLGQAVNRALLTAVATQPDNKSIREAAQKSIEPIIAGLPESEREVGGEEIRQSVKTSLRRLTDDWMKFFLAYDPRPALRKIQCPTLVIIGTKDTQVVPSVNTPEIEKALTEGGNKDFEIVIIDGLNHMFQKCEHGGMSEYATIKETFNPKALQTIGDWIAERVTMIR